MEEVTFKGAEPKSAEEYKPYTPATVKLLSITQGFSLPLLSAESGGPKSNVYTLDDPSLTVGLTLKVTSEDGGSVVETPLAMCKYVKPEGDFIYDAEVCREATFTNLSREAHNAFIIKLLNAFMTPNDVGTSAGKITQPEPPADCNKLRLKAIKELTSDKLNTSRRAIKYLADREIYCGRDYDFDVAFETANDQAFKDTCMARAATGKVRVRLEGCPPSWWDGSSPQDSAGHYVAWKRGEGHTFLTPSARVVQMALPDIVEPQLLLENNTVVDEEKKPALNPFDSLNFATTAPLKALTLPPPESKD
ncbi:MAG: hypothetical protein P4L69_15640 [Desulfosporosinus sp.]|nr:hypothetical protein [Desulfosporosinus sp.]